MTDKMPVTPLPWAALVSDLPYEELGPEGWVVESEGSAVFVADGPLVGREQDCRYAARACNSFPALLEALEELLAMREAHLVGRVHPKGEFQIIADARAALAAAKGEA